MTEFLIAFLVFYVWHGTGVTIGYHRLLSHRSFKCIKPVEYFFVLAGYLAFEGSPIWWAAIHRAHHRYVDTPLDPHSPRYGIAHSYFGWLFELVYPRHIDPAVLCVDIVKDPVYQFLEQGGDLRKMNNLCFASNIAFRVLLLVTVGWKIALASMIASVAVLQIPLMLNLICHLPKLGYKNFATNDDSVNVWWVGILAHGEGWHNNHHAYPGSARNGMKWFEFDFSYLVIQTLKALKMVSWVNPGPDIEALPGAAPYLVPQFVPQAYASAELSEMEPTASPATERVEVLELSGRRR